MSTSRSPRRRPSSERSTSSDAADATHLATAVAAGADRFITNNQRDFPQTIEEIDVVYPADLPDPEETDHG